MVPSPSRTIGLVALVLAPVLALGTACSAAGPHRADGDPASPSASAGGAGSGAPRQVRLPAADAEFDYQLDDPYPPAGKVRAVSRDRTAEPADGLYNICYVNAFQTQPGEAVTWWEKRHPDLLLKDDGGDPVTDEDWDEPLLDISTPARRAALMDIVGPWIDGCATAGYDAVEPDNLDSYERSDGKLTSRHAAAFARLLADRAHDRHLAVAQKNTSDLLPQRKRIGFDFAVVEECARYQECADFDDAYDGRIFDIEYVSKDFTAACRSWGESLSVTLRDRDVRPAGTEGHVRKSC
ncbi:endo alpha-1,4 polygalactosaminidase [Streptomyces sp. NPDC048248]|uniref:endo alpha-1,4 polygalactosaminidase n=1 Tax=Streptomyces sp. NPDC048248 TaxID=3365523 RepID=UPI00372053E9